jgi:Protein of unknown function (DUF3035)
MLANRGATAIAIAAMLALTACGGDKTPSLMNVRSATNGPDEFGILPPKALELPEDFAALPEPTLCGANRTDPTPFDDAIIALGGTPRAAGGIPAADGALVRHGTRFGTQAGIRETLAAEDLEYRRKNDGRLLERLFNVNVYFKAYRKQSLDQQADLLKWRKRGLRTPSAPPANPGEE